MDDLIRQIKAIDSKIDDIVPILVADNCQEAGDAIQNMFRELTDVFQKIIQMQDLTAEIALSSYINSLKCFSFAMHTVDTIQIADILLYEIRGMFHGIYEFCERGV